MYYICLIMYYCMYVATYVYGNIYKSIFEVALCMSTCTRHLCTYVNNSPDNSK